MKQVRFEIGQASSRGVLIEMEEESEEARPLKRITHPLEPSPEERRSHAVRHLPYRTWCTHFGLLLPLILVARERETHVTCAVQVPEKGTKTAFPKKRMLACLRELGYKFCTFVFLLSEVRCCLEPLHGGQRLTALERASGDLIGGVPWKT